MKHAGTRCSPFSHGHLPSLSFLSSLLSNAGSCVAALELNTTSSLGWHRCWPWRALYVLSIHHFEFDEHQSPLKWSPFSLMFIARIRMASRGQDELSGWWGRSTGAAFGGSLVLQQFSLSSKSNFHQHRLQPPSPISHTSTCIVTRWLHYYNMQLQSVTK